VSNPAGTGIVAGVVVEPGGPGEEDEDAEKDDVDTGEDGWIESADSGEDDEEDEDGTEEDVDVAVDAALLEDDELVVVSPAAGWWSEHSWLTFASSRLKSSLGKLRSAAIIGVLGRHVLLVNASSNHPGMEDGLTVVLWKAESSGGS
jgi:hypothetical protein